MSTTALEGLKDSVKLARFFRAMRHPIRLRVITALGKGDVTHSPSELAEMFNEPLGVVSYHVRKLHEAKMLRLARKVPRRGAMEHYYRLSPEGWKLYRVAREISDLIS